MNASDYQTKAARTLIAEPDHPFTGNEQMLMWCALGLGGEAGEVLDHLKKGICHQHGIDRLKIKEELGDLMWYVAGIATLLDISLDAVMSSNIAKLEYRYPNGYNSDDSKARIDTADAYILRVSADNSTRRRSSRD
jgi:NTP pyrophosphatase (non-canonical NTP hydrolase)